MIDFNVNEHCFVKLTELGRKHLRIKHAKLVRETGVKMDYMPKEENEQGWSKWQMHELMSSFGDLVGTCGFNIPFESNIKLWAGSTRRAIAKESRRINR